MACDGVGRQRGRVRVVGEGDLLERRRDDARLERLAGVGGQFRVRVRLRGGRAGLDEVVRLDLRLDQVGDDRRMRGKEALRHDEQGGDAGLAEQHRTAVADHLDVVGRGLGAAGDLPGLELEHRGRVGLGRLDEGVAAAGRGGGQAVLLEPVAQRDVLGVAQRRSGQRLALELGRRGDALRDHDGGAAGRGSRDDLDGAAAGLLPGVDGRVRPDIGGVELAGQQCRGLLGPAAERGGLQRAGGAEGLGEEALLQADQGRGMRDVVRKPSLTVTGALPPALSSPGRRVRRRGRRRRAASQQQGSADHRGGRDTSHLVPNFYRLYRNYGRFTIHEVGNVGNRSGKVVNRV